jgi:hypothetical protein
MFSLKIEKIKSEQLETAEVFLKGQSRGIAILFEGWEN